MRLLVSIPLLLLLATPAAAQSTCTGAANSCISFCLETQRPQQNCRAYCDDQLRKCRVTGCWTRIKALGGHTNCGLARR